MRTKYSFHFYEVETTPLIVRFFKALFLFLFTIIVAGVVTVLLFGKIFLQYIEDDIMNSSAVIVDLGAMPVNLSSAIYYRDPATGEYTEWYILASAENRVWIDGEEIPQQFKDAFIAIEDERFWEHRGVDWKRKLVRADLEELLGMPVAVENHVKARAIGQDLFCRASRPDVYLYYFVQAGISCCIMTGGEPFGSGKQGTGDISHAIMDLNGPICACGRRGCLQVFSGEGKLLEQGRRLVKEGKDPILVSLTGGGEPLTMELLLQAAEAGDGEVREILRNGVRYMGISIANIINLVNSPLVVIDSAVTTLPEMQKYLDEVIQENNYFKEELEVEIDYIAASRYTGALGACAVAVKELFIRRP